MEGDAGASRLNPTGSDDSADNSDTETPANSTPDEDVAGPPPSRVSRGWFVGIFVVLVLMAAGLVTGGVLAMNRHTENKGAAQSEQAAMDAAKDCITATNAPDPATMAKSVQKILDCSTGDFGVSAKFMAPMVVEAYQVANAKVEVTTLRAATEKFNDDGTIDVLVAFRFKVPTNPQQQNHETGVRWRATMRFEDGRYKIDKLVQVLS
jgi:Mce-associated membrane protein